MIFDTLKEKCEYYRSLTDYRVMPNGCVLVMLDGNNFSTLIKNKFEKPFDDWFIDTMNKTAEYLCKNVQGVVGAYVQSDEITLVINDNTLTSLPYNGRLCKLQSLVAGKADSFFTKKIITHAIRRQGGVQDAAALTAYIENMPDYIFDCKVWAVPNANEAIAWFLYRQIDCIRNSKQQFCQTYILHDSLKNHSVDEQVAMCLDATGHDWNRLSEDKKYGRFMYKKTKRMVADDGHEYERSEWKISTGELTDEYFREGVKVIWLKNIE